MLVHAIKCDSKFVYKIAFFAQHTKVEKKNISNIIDMVVNIRTDTVHESFMKKHEFSWISKHLILLKIFLNYCANVIRSLFLRKNMHNLTFLASSFISIPLNIWSVQMCILRSFPLHVLFVKITNVICLFSKTVSRLFIFYRNQK